MRLLGVSDQASELFNRALEKDLCFGKGYAKTAQECGDCLCPVISDGKLYTLNEICATRTKSVQRQFRKAKAGAGDFSKFAVRELVDMLGQGMSVVDIYFRMLGEANIDLVGGEARKHLWRQCYYLREKRKMPIPYPPTLEELRAHVSDQ